MLSRRSSWVRVGYQWAALVGRQRGVATKGASFRIPTLPPTTVPTPSPPSSVTKRKKEALEKMPLDEAILRRLDHQGVGHLPKAIHHKMRKIEGYGQGRDNLATYPFNSIGKVIQHVHEWDDNAVGLLLSPECQAPQVALVGRSNVGKSTLLNALMGFNSTFTQRALTSEKPGQTKELTFYRVGRVNPKQPDGPPALVVIDMPGYGFSFMAEADHQRCRDLTTGLLLGGQTLQQKNLKRVLLLIDSRHGLKKADVDFLKDVEAAVTALRSQPEALSFPKKMSWKLQVVFTKGDLVERRLLCRRMQKAQEDLRALVPAWLYSDMLPVIALSSIEKRGVVALQKEISALVPSISRATRQAGRDVVFTTVGDFVKAEPSSPPRPLRQRRTSPEPARRGLDVKL